jgi:4-diphosphocytidyl-2C-methyl-D-erythritol kinase
MNQGQYRWTLIGVLILKKHPGANGSFDGFHDLETIMAKINVSDELIFEFNNSPKPFELTCTGENWAPQGPENLV